MTSAGARKFDVFLNSALVKENLDIYAEANGNAIAYVFEQQSYEVTGGSLEVSFGQNIQNPKVSCELFLVPS